MSYEISAICNDCLGEVQTRIAVIGDFNIAVQYLVGLVVNDGTRLDFVASSFWRLSAMSTSRFASACS
jgi:hypothetical protein